MLALRWPRGNHRLLAGAATLFAASVYFTACFQAAAQPAAIVVPAEWRIEAGRDAPIGIEVRTGDAAPGHLLLLIRGLPGAIALSHGRLFESGVWALRLGDLPKLKIATRKDSIGSSELSLSLVGVDGTVLAQGQARLVIAERVAASAPPPPPAPGPVEDVNARPTAAPIAPEKPRAGGDLSLSLPPPAPPPATPEARAEALQLMARGDENLKTGKVIVARKFYERAAELGWAPGALALGRTYDPQELAKVAVIGGIKPDVALARTWYERARDMGLAEAAERLQQISNR